MLLMLVFICVAGASFAVIKSVEKQREDDKVAFDLLKKINKMMERKNFVRRVIIELQMADLKFRYGEYIGLYILCMALPIIITIILGGHIIFALLLGVAGASIPRIFVVYKQHQRLKNIDSQLIDTLVLISNSLKAGYSFGQGMELVSEEAPDPIASEFKRVMKEVSFGYSLDRALANMEERIPSEDLKLTITAVNIQRTIGGNLSEILDNIVHTIRERLRIKGEINVLTAQGKMQGIIIFLLPIILCIIIYAMNPAFILPLMITASGKILLIIAIILQIIGGLMIKDVIDIKV